MCADSSCIARDTAGNETRVNFEKIVESVVYVVQLTEILYNGVAYNFNFSGVYARSSYRDNDLWSLNQKILDGDHLVNIEFKRTSNISYIKETKNGQTQKQQMWGVVIAHMYTDRGDLLIEY